MRRRIDNEEDDDTDFGVACPVLIFEEEESAKSIPPMMQRARAIMMGTCAIRVRRERREIYWTRLETSSVLQSHVSISLCKPV